MIFIEKGLLPKWALHFVIEPVIIHPAFVVFILRSQFLDFSAKYGSSVHTLFVVVSLRMKCKQNAMYNNKKKINAKREGKHDERALQCKHAIWNEFSNALNIFMWTMGDGQNVEIMWNANARADCLFDCFMLFRVSERFDRRFWQYLPL